MPGHDGDISWPVLRRIVQDWSGTSAELAEVKPLIGGCINTTLLLVTSGGERAVLKISPHRVNKAYARESHQLQLLRECGLPVPQVYQTQLGDLDQPDSYLLMQYIPGMNLGEARKHLMPDEFNGVQEHLAELMLVMHGHTADAYQRVTPEGDERFASWPQFYRHVYDQIWRETEKAKVLPVKCRKQISKIHDRLDRLIAHSDKPRLVHWDIWATNLMVNQDEQGRWRIAAVLDPNCKYAHHEAEIAYMDLFHTINPAFLKAYQRDKRFEEGYHRIRRAVYQLYPLIDHVHLFGQDYVKPLMEVVDRLSTAV
jgi:fructosamine-3-kinase